VFTSTIYSFSAIVALETSRKASKAAISEASTSCKLAKESARLV